MGSVFDNVIATGTRFAVPDAGMDSNVPGINSGASGGGRITGNSFLTAGDLLPGQDQTLVYSGDQTILVEKNQYNRIKGKRDTEITLEELYINKHNVTYYVEGEFVSKFHKKTTSEWVGPVNYDYFAPFRVKEHQGFTRIRNLNETIIFTGNQHISFDGDQLIEQTGNRTRLAWGSDLMLAAPLRFTAIGGLEIKTAAIDWSLSLLKHVSSLIDAKEAVLEGKKTAVSLDAAIAKFAPFILLGRVGAICLKGVGAALGSIRW